MTSLAVFQDSTRLLEKNGYYLTVARRSFCAGEAVFPVSGEVLDHPTPYTIQVACGRHIMTELGRYVNHSCDPNCYFDPGGLVFRARRPIRSEEELTFNYNTTEFDMSRSFICRCGTDACVGRISGYKHLHAQERLDIAPLAAAYLKVMDNMAVEQLYAADVEFSG